MEWILSMKYSYQGYKGKGPKLNWNTCNHFWSSRCNECSMGTCGEPGWFTFFLFLVITVSFCSNFVLFFQRQDVMNGIWENPFSHYAFFVVVEDFFSFVKRQDVMNGEWVNRWFIFSCSFLFLVTFFWNEWNKGHL